MPTDATSLPSPRNRGTRKLLLAGAGVLAIGAVVAQAASVNSRRPGMSAMISTSLASLIAAKAAGVTPPPTPTPAPPPVVRPGDAPFKLGMNLTGIDFYHKDRALMNIVHGSFWHLDGAGGGFRQMPAEYLDERGWVKALPPGGRAIKLLNQPIVPEGGLDIVCRYDGKGLLDIVGGTSNVQRQNGMLRFRLHVRYPQIENLALSYATMDMSDPIRNIDCREADASPTQLFDPEFLNFVRNFHILRLMDWMRTNDSHHVTWASRARPGDGDYLTRGGVPVETMVELAKQTGADPWFNMSWFADDTFIRGFATYVRDNLPPERTIYVEASNEVWNAMFIASQKAGEEGIARGLNPDAFAAKLNRYSQRTIEVMRIWSEVFDGQMHRIVRVVGTQHVNPWTAEQVLGWRDTANYVDALATAPYVGYDISNIPALSASQDLSVLFARLDEEIPERMAQSLANKAVATKYGKRYLSYEAGQHVINHADVPTLTRLNRDERMGRFYERYINAWRTTIGDALMLFGSTGPITGYGGWGLQEYTGQPASEAPKVRAAMANRSR